MIARTPSDLGLLVRSRRRELGLDQQALAQRAGVSRMWLIEFEKGKPRAEIGLVMRTLAALDLHLDVSPAAPPPARPSAGSSSSRRAPLPDLDAIVESARKRK